MIKLYMAFLIIILASCAKHDISKEPTNLKSFCERLTSVETKDECLSWLSVRLNEEEYCNLITTPAERDRCLINHAKEISDCKDFNGSSYYSCLDYFMFNATDQKLCEYFDQYRNISYGSKNQIVTARSDCLLHVAVTTNDSEICSGIIDDGKHDKCYLELIDNAKSADYCNILKSGDKRSTCRYIFAVINHKADICQTLLDAFSKDNCYNSIAMSLNDSAYCRFINQSFIADECYKEIAHDTLDPEVCEYLSADTLIKDCRNSLAKALKDISLCSGAETKECHAAVNILEAVDKMDGKGCAMLGQ